MFHYNNHNQPRFQTPSIGASRQRIQHQNQNLDSFHASKGIGNRSQNENYHASYSAVKPSFNTQQINKRSKQRRFGTNLTNKRPLRRINYNNQYEQSKTAQIFKPSKNIHFKSRNQNENENIMSNKWSNNQISKSSFKFNIGMKNKSKQNQADMNEPEYCPKGTSWKPSINKSLQKLFKKAFKIIGEYKLFIPSNKTTKIEYEIQENFETIHEPKLSNNSLYETDSDFTDNDYNHNQHQYERFSFALPPQNCHIPLVRFHSLCFV